jgi:hypothetical protein
MKNFTTQNGNFLALSNLDNFKVVKGKRIISDTAVAIAHRVRDKDLEVMGTVSVSGNQELDIKLGQSVLSIEGVNALDTIFKIITKEEPPLTPQP